MIALVTPATSSLVFIDAGDPFLFGVLHSVTLDSLVDAHDTDVSLSTQAAPYCNLSYTVGQASAISIA